MTPAPSLPPLGPRDPIPAGAITCVDCGQPLELACAGGCRKAGASIEAATTAHPSVAHESNVAQRKARTYQPKACSCGRTFTPTGPRAVWCAECRR